MPCAWMDPKAVPVPPLGKVRPELGMVRRGRVAEWRVECATSMVMEMVRS